MSAIRPCFALVCVIVLGCATVPEPTMEAAVPQAPAPEAAVREPALPVPLGPVRLEGQLHEVVKGDTLWDISAFYLDTPWIWPDVWEENPKIKNPHLIYPGDLIWINRNLMRRVTQEDLLGLMMDPRERALDPRERALGPLEFVPEPELPAAPAPAPAPLVVDKVPDPFEALDQGESAMEQVLHYPGLHRVGFVSPDQLAGSAAVLGSHQENYWTAQLQRTIVSLGEGQVHIGDAFTVYRVRRRVLHPDTGKVMGYFTQILGRVEISEIHPEASYVQVVRSYVEIEPGDRIMPYEEPPQDLVVKQLAHPVKGTIIAQQPYRQYSAWHDFVILDRGAGHGLEPGNRFAIYREGREVRDPLTGAKVLVPDDVIGQLFIVKVTPGTAVGVITRSRRKIHEGDRFRNL